ncbi:hypothetical protein FACS1894200_01150 [Spirochaetia bacterium]|nr:hypothetical protein FACS1894200_01150 [Spirochaetia bacterium]
MGTDDSGIDTVGPLCGGAHGLECRWVLLYEPPELVADLLHSVSSTATPLDLVF